MSKQNEILRLKGLGLAERAIARNLSISRNTVKKYLVDDDDGSPSEVKLEELVFWYDQIDWKSLENEHSKGVTLKVLWEELHHQGVVPVNYPNFWKQFERRFPNMRPVTMARSFDPGSRIEIDYCDGIDILDISTGEISKTHLFVGVLCYSRYTFAEFSYTQSSTDFLSSHVRMFNFFGGVPHTMAPDNLKSAVTTAHPYDPEINPAYMRLAEHYNFAPTPARVRRPKDKPIVERTVQIFQKWFYGKVRNQTFTSIVELNIALTEALAIFNKKEHRIFKKSREEMFIDEKLHLLPLPDKEYVVRSHKLCTLHHDCHFQFDDNFYSAPWHLREQQLNVWSTDTQIEVFFKGECVAVHSRKKNRGKFITDRTHYPPAHQAYLEVTPSYLREKAATAGPAVFELVNTLMNDIHPLRHLRQAQGIISLQKKFEVNMLDKACSLAIQYGRLNYRFVKKALQANCFDNQQPKAPLRGSNNFLRGQELFN